MRRRWSLWVVAAAVAVTVIIIGVVVVVVVNVGRGVRALRWLAPVVGCWLVF